MSHLGPKPEKSEHRGPNDSKLAEDIFRFGNIGTEDADDQLGARDLRTECFRCPFSRREHVGLD